MIFSRVVEYFSRRRYSKQSGIDITHAEAKKVVQLWPITSKGKVSETAYFEIPVEDMDAFIKELLEAKLKAA